MVCDESLNYRDLLKAHAIFELISKGDTSYWDFYGKETWSLNNLNVKTVKVPILKFLNKYQSHISYRVAPQLLDKLRDCKVHFDRLGNTDLTHCNFEVGSSEITSVFSKLEPLIHSTGTSKVLHMIKPKLLVMWDRDIREKMCHFENGLSNGDIARKYVDFLKEMHNQAIDILKSYVETHEDTSNYSEAEKIIEKTCNGKTLAKLMDEYNYIHVHYDVKPEIECPYCNKNIKLGV